MRNSSHILLLFERKINKKYKTELLFLPFTIFEQTKTTSPISTLSMVAFKWAVLFIALFQSQSASQYKTHSLTSSYRAFFPLSETSFTQLWVQCPAPGQVSMRTGGARDWTTDPLDAGRHPSPPKRRPLVCTQTCSVPVSPSNWEMKESPPCLCREARVGEDGVQRVDGWACQGDEYN